MKPITVNGQAYHLSSTLNPFQLEMQVHLVNWKWAHITSEPGLHGEHPNDALLPKAFDGQYPTLYPGIVGALKSHQEKFPFHFHQYFHHMASSQAANLNLFLPFLLHSQASIILRALKPDFARLALSELDHGFRIEYWDEPFGNLADHTHLSGTDADIAIAYYNRQNELCLWLIEHKLTESEFTTCGGFKSPGKKAKHDCSQTFATILADPHLCYYHDVKHFNYWKITAANQDFFPNHAGHAHCPFQGGLNQLWRNQMLGLSIEKDEYQPYRHVAFSVVRHPRNNFLNTSLTEYRHLIANNPKFTVFTSADVIRAAAELHDPDLDRWIAWYRDLYAL
jgi:hypothetical protein